MEAPEIGLEGFSARAQWSRRGFVMTSLITGFALSMQPVSAETITTDTNGLDAGEVKVPVADGSIPAYRAMPAQGGPFPTVLVVQEVFGVHEHIKDICRRLAKAHHGARNGAQLENVQKAAGHPDPSTTKQYDRRSYNPEKAASSFATY